MSKIEVSVTLSYRGLMNRTKDSLATLVLQYADTNAELNSQRDALQAEVERLRTAARLEEFAGAFEGEFWDEFFAALNKRKAERDEEKP